MYTIEFWKGALERAVATFLQSLLGLVGIVEVGIINVSSFAWSEILVSALFIAGLSLVKSVLAGIKDGNPSIGNLEVAVPKESTEPEEAPKRAELTLSDDDYNRLGG
jgi:hypothetical protein